jgi:hypothetical protein
MLVLTGANPGAFIDVPVLAHSGEEVEDEAIIYTGEEISLSHADKEEEEDDASEETVQDVMDTLTDKQRKVVYALIYQALHNGEEEEAVEHSDSEPDDYETLYNGLTDKEKEMVQYLVGKALDDNSSAIEHAEADDDDETIQDIYDGFNEDQKKLVHILIGKAVADKNKGTVQHADEDVAQQPNHRPSWSGQRQRDAHGHPADDAQHEVHFPVCANAN